MNFYTKKIIGNYGLKGASHRQLKRQRGLKGLNSYGPAGECTTVKGVERAAIEQKLQAEGAISEVALQPKRKERLLRKEYWAYLQSEAWQQLKGRFLAANPVKVCYCCATTKGGL